MKKLIFGLFSLMVLAISCKKDDPDPVAPTNKPYLNTNAGTNWTYDVKTLNPATGDTTAVIDTATVGIDTTINAKTYKIVNHTNGNAKSYYNLTGNDYYQFQYLPAPIDTSIEALYLKDNVAANTTWNQSISLDFMGVPLPLTITYTVTAVGGSKTVNGITYNDVITVKTDLTSAGLPSGSIVSNINNYYTRDIGLIQADYNIDISLAGLNLHSQTLLKNADLH